MSVIRMFRVGWRAERQQRIRNWDGEGGSSVENSRVGEVERLLQRYGSMREQSTVDGRSTGKKGRRRLPKSRAPHNYFNAPKETITLILKL